MSFNSITRFIAFVGKNKIASLIAIILLVVASPYLALDSVFDLLSSP